MNNKALALTLALALASILCGPAFADGAPSKAAWTVMVYMCADNDLDAFGPKDMAEMELEGSSDKVNIVAQLDRRDLPARRYRITKRTPDSPLDDWGVASELLSEQGEVDMGDHRELAGFVAWAVNGFPAEKYAVIVWNHGSGWKSAFPASRGIAYDFQTGNNISTPGLGKALAAGSSVAGKKIDLLVMDACLMQMIEVICEVVGGVSFVAASEEIEPGEGIPYAPFIAALNASPAMSPSALAAFICASFKERYSDHGGHAKLRPAEHREGTKSDPPAGRAPLDARRAPAAPAIYSAVDCDAANALLDELDALACAFSRLDETAKASLRAAASKVSRFTYVEYADLGHFLALLSACALPKEASDAVTKCEIAYGKAVVSNVTVGIGPELASGISFYYPRYAFKPHYSELRIAARPFASMVRELAGSK